MRKRLFAFDAVIYTFLLLVLVFMKGSNQGINLIPFDFVREYILKKEPLGFSNIIGNILMFVPFGIFLGIKKTTVCKSIVRILALTLTIEIIQFIFKRGISDIDDVILNLIGGLIGLACYYALSKLKYRDELLLMFMLILFLSMILLILALHFGLFGVYIRIF